MSKKIIARVAIILAGSAFISACAPMISGVMNASVDENSVFEKTAKYFGVARESITISSIEKGALETSYQAKHAGKIYNCLIYYGAVSCKQPGVQNDLVMTAGEGSRLELANDHTMTPAQAQARLNQLGYPVGSPDGVFGKKSVEKLKLFQKSRGLAASGKLDYPTIEALR